ncbi:PP2C family protein-serine/threonine phosphatase [Pelagivirga sediminicola]|uniref:PP2C family protein-serine/threonine phosphatase n=1 Tax=Pelagivirga sediminicola TaxID=2170575 RepID=UPI003F6DF7AF
MSHSIDLAPAGEASDAPTAPRAIRHILVVDDSRLQRRILAASLKKWGFAITEADSGEAALEICRQTPPDLVLSDWMMPGMSGIEFCGRFRQMARENYGYFILLTSKSDKAEIASGLDAGADDFLTKPVNPGELRARIAAGERILQMERELTQKNQLVSSTLGELRALYDSLDNDLIEAKKLQQSLVSDRHRDYGTAEVSMLLRSSGHVGGDLVGTYAISDTRIGLYGIDVSGHGISSALMTARLAGYLSGAAPEQNVAMRRMPDGTFAPHPPGQTIAALNNLFLNEMETEHYFTLLLADVDLATGRVVMAQAGHPYPAVQRADGTVEAVGCGGLPVGLIPGAEFQEFEVQLAPGDRLMIHSDGVTECAAQDGTLLDDDGLGRILRDLRGVRAMACLESLIWKLAEFSGDDNFADDVSAILLEIKPIRPSG